jgi:type IV pilus assembly protein PilO
MAQIKLTKQQQQMIVAGILILGGFGYSYYTFFWAPIARKIEDTKATIEKVEAKINKAKQVSARLPRLEAELVRLNDQAVEAERRLPKKKSVPEILVTVGGLAEKNHVTLVSFTPGAIVAKQFFSELNYPISVKGSYHNIGRFLASIALEERIFNVQNVLYGEAAPDGTMTVTFTLISYQYKG